MIDMKLMEYLDRAGQHLTEEVWNTFGKDISNLRFSPEEWKEKIALMEQFCDLRRKEKLAPLQCNKVYISKEEFYRK